MTTGQFKTSYPGDRESLNCVTDLSSNEHRFVKISDDNTVAAITSGAGLQDPYGILVNKPVSGEVAEVQINGLALLRAPAATPLSYSNKVATDLNGYGIAATSGMMVRAEVVKGCASGELATVRLCKYQLIG